MNEPSKDLGLLTVLMERLEQQRLPRALDMLEKVNGGERLDELDLAFLEETLADASSVKPLIERYPEYQELAARVVGLYAEITAKGLENEERARAPDGQ
jgi:hypothetical protein